VRPTEPVLTDYGKNKEIEAYVKTLVSYKDQNPNNIIFRNKNLHKDLKVEAAKIDEKLIDNR
jgi:hypothetical protein